MVIKSRAPLVIGLLVAALVTVGCTIPFGDPTRTSGPSVASTLSTGRAPAEDFAIGVRTLNLARGADRPLTTTVWYPAVGSAATAVRTDAVVAPGRHPVVIFSHGLRALPENYAELAGYLAAAGFIVAAPQYPKTNLDAHPISPADAVNQPDDAYYVLDVVLRLDTHTGDPLANHVDTEYVAVAGHGTGAFTTAAMLRTDRPTKLTAAVILSGGSQTTFAGPPTPVLFVHGDQDTTMPYGTARAAYDKTTWPKGFLTLRGSHYTDYLHVQGDGFVPLETAVTNFLRWQLYDDLQAEEYMDAFDPTGEFSTFDQAW